MRGSGSPQALYRHRRYAREAAMHALFVAESQGLSIESALRQTFAFYESDEVQEEFFREMLAEGTSADELIAEGKIRELFEGYARRIAEGVWQDKMPIDDVIREATTGYELERLAGVDRNILRVALWELENVPHISPAVTVNEAVEIAKKYSTTESGKFVNGVLGTLVARSSKANWDPEAAPADPELPKLEEVFRPRRVEPVVETVEEGSEEAKTARRFGVWTIRQEDPKP